MSGIRCICLAFGVLVLGTLVTGSAARAGDKKKESGKEILNKSDELTDKDEKDTNPLLKNQPRKVYKVKLTEGKGYQIDMKSEDLDSVLRLEDAEGKQVAINDDFSKGLDSRILYRVPKTEEYRIIATCLEGKFTGRKNVGKFTLTVVEQAVAEAATIALKLEKGQASHEGQIGVGDAKFKDKLHKRFSVTLAEGKTYQIDHKSKDFDAFLFLLGPDGTELAFNDDFGGTLDSRIVHRAAKGGTYHIIATSLGGGGTGAFTLTVKDAE